MAAVTLDLFQMLRGLNFGGHDGTLVLPFILQPKGVQGGDLIVQTTGRMHDHSVAIPHHVPKGVAPCGE